MSKPFWYYWCEDKLLTGDCTVYFEYLVDDEGNLLTITNIHNFSNCQSWIIQSRVCK